LFALLFYEQVAAAEKLKREKMQGPGMNHFKDPNLNPQESNHLSLKAAVYNAYPFKPAKRNPLAIDAYKDQVLRVLKASNALIVKGFTGCGKTTQVPQFILDSCAATRTPCNIVITQPKRIAAISAAERVSQERGWDLGTVVGYHVSR
jgi:HrpA-like RNA helicase